VKPEIPTTLMDKMKRLPDLMKMASYPPKSVRTGICQQVVHEGSNADLTKLPIIQCWPLDGDLSSEQIAQHAQHAGTERSGVPDQPRTAKYITLGGIFTTHPETGDQNTGMYRVHLFGPKKCATHWQMHHDGARHFRAYQK